MKIISILGSPRKKGNTATVLSVFEDKVGIEHEVERINIVQYHVGGCIGCYKCKDNKSEPGCVQIKTFLYEVSSCSVSCAKTNRVERHTK